MDDIQGLYEVEFTTGTTEMIDILQNVVGSDGKPIYLICCTGKIFNWMNIISIRKM